MNARYTQVQKLAAAHPIAGLCVLLAVSRSGYYDWRGRAPSRRQQEDARLTQELKSVFAQSRGTYGRPRLTHAVRARGEKLGQRRVGAIDAGRRAMRAHAPAFPSAHHGQRS